MTAVFYNPVDKLIHNFVAPLISYKVQHFSHLPCTTSRFYSHVITRTTLRAEIENETTKKRRGRKS